MPSIIRTNWDGRIKAGVTLLESGTSDLAAWQTSSEFYLGEAGKVIREDEEAFTDRKKLFGLVAEERIIIPGNLYKK